MKNLKMFAISLVAFAAMTMGVHAAASVAEYKGNQSYSNLETAITAAITDGGGKVTLLDDYQLTSAVTITEDVELDLNGHKLTVPTGANTITVATTTTAKLTISNSNATKATITTTRQNPGIIVGAKGTLEIGKNIVLENTYSSVSSNGIIKVAGNLTIVDGAEVNAAGSTLLALDGADTSKIELGGYYNVDKVVAPSATTKAVIDAKGEFDTAATAFEVSNGLTLNVTGTITTKTGVAINVPSSSKGTLNITAGTVKSEDDIAVDVKTGTNPVTVKISGGKVIGKTYAVKLSNADAATVYEISGDAYLESSKPTDYYALDITDLITGKDASDFEKKPYLNIHNILTGGHFKKTIYNEESISDVVRVAYTVIYDYLVADGYEVATEGDYEIVRKISTPADPEEQDPNVGDGDANDQKPAEDVPNVPKTGDNILVYASLGLISAVSVGFTAKRKENN